MFTIEETTRKFKVLLYGQAGVGKSTLASKSKNPAMIDLEEGSPHIRMPKVTAKDFEETKKHLINAANSPFDTIVVDSYTYLEKMIHRLTAQASNKAHISDIGFFKGYRTCDVQWEEIRMLIKQLTKAKNVICISHTSVQEVTDVVAGAYDEFRPYLYKESIEGILADFDGVFFIKPGIIVNDDKAFQTNKTFVYTQPAPGICAKSRFKIASKIELDKWNWDDIKFQY